MLSVLRKMFGRDSRPKVMLSREKLIRIPIDNSKQNYLSGFWLWVKLLEDKEYQKALEALYWEEGTNWTAEALENRITTFFGGNKKWHVVVPNDRLVNEINEAAEVEPAMPEGGGWFLATIPLTTEPNNPKDDEIPLMGLAVSFFVKEYNNSYILVLEIFHL